MRKPGFFPQTYKPEHIKAIMPRVMSFIWLRYSHRSMSKNAKGVGKMGRADVQRKDGAYKRGPGEEPTKHMRAESKEVVNEIKE